MATLEIHDALGRVHFVELDRSHPILFGSSPACDIVLSGEGVLPVHGRIRWKGRRYKVDASPDAEFLLVNGTRLVSGSLRQGDELTVGGSRIIAVQVDDGSTLKSDHRKNTIQREDRETATEILQGPPRSPKEKPAGEPARPPIASIIDDEDFLESLAPAAPEGGSVEELGHVGAGRSRRDSPPQGLVGRIRDRWRQAKEIEDAPDGATILRSPTVVALALLFVLLVGMGFWLYGIIARTIASRTFNHAIVLMEDGDNATAIRQFDAFLLANPDDVRAGKAKTLRALANVRQYITVSGATWSRAREAAEEMVEAVGDLPEFRDEKTELGELAVRIGEGLAERAKRTVDRQILAEAESIRPLHAKIVGDASAAFLTRSRLPDLLNEAHAAIRKADARTATLEAMSQAIERGSAADVYKGRDALLKTYADLANDSEIVKRMVQANDLVRQATKFNPSRRPAETEERREQLGPPTILVMRSSSPPPANSQERPVFTIVDGEAYALDAMTGAPLWRTSVGLASSVFPTLVPNDSSVLIFDARYDELCRRDLRTGRLIWRQSLEEAIDGHPLVLGEQVYQVAPSGRLLVLSLSTGELQGSIDLGFPATRTPTSDESGRYLYVIGARDCLFTFTRDPFACVDVQYLGHLEGSIPCEAARLGRFLVVVENHHLEDGRWRVLYLDEGGSKPGLVQTLSVSGWTWDAPKAAGSWIWAVGDRGGLEVFAAGDYGSTNPFRSITRLTPDATTSGPAFAFPSSERELWIAGGRTGRFDLDVEGGRLTSRFTLGHLGAAAGPIQSAGNRLVLSFQSAGGGVSLRGVDPASGRLDWHTVLGADWPTKLASSTDGAKLSGVDRTGRRIEIARDHFQRGGFVVSMLPKPGDPHAPEGSVLEFQRHDETMTLIVPAVGESEVWSETAPGSGIWSRVELPAPLAADPVAWAGGLLTPGEDGRVYLVDPKSGLSIAEPLVPPFDRDTQGRWLTPASLGDAVVLADDSGRIRRLIIRETPDRRISVDGETMLDQRIVSAPACTDSAIVVVTADGLLRSLSGRDLSPIGSWPLSAPLVSPPAAVDGRVAAFDASGAVHLLDRDGRRLWSVDRRTPLVGAPAIRDGSLWVLDQGGDAHALAMTDGRELQSIPLGVLPVGGLVVLGPDILVPSGRGVLRPLLMAPLNQEASP